MPHLPQFSNTQTEAIRLFATTHQNLFITGSAGTGKSTVVQEIRRVLGDSAGHSAAFAAWTGMAASQIQGATLHSLFGRRMISSLQDFAEWEEHTVLRVKALRVLIIDEISMVSGEFLDRLDYKVRAIRGVDRVFGGIRLVFCGDFFQLPPIEQKARHCDSSRRRRRRQSGSSRRNAKRTPFLNRGYAFQSHMWESAQFMTVQLRGSQRLSPSDNSFLHALDRVRRGEIIDGDATCKYIQSLHSARPQAKKKPPPSSLQPALIYKTNKLVARYNAVRLTELLKDPRRAHKTMVAYDAVQPDAEVVDDADAARKLLLRHSFFRTCMAPHTLQLCEGAQVMLLKNLDLTSDPERPLMNGSIGVVRQIVSAVQVANWPKPVHGDSPDSGGGGGGSHVCVRIAFDNGREELIAPANFSEEVFMLGTCSRKQMPLQLAWAVTVHKSQGLTLSSAEVDLSGKWTTEGMAYVALSRVTSPDRLTVRHFDAAQVRASPVVMQFYEQLDAGVHPANRGIPKWDAGGADKLCADGYCDMRV
jgi:ATP-dependent DNA helicase PIF1